MFIHKSRVNKEELAASLEAIVQENPLDKVNNINKVKKILVSNCGLVVPKEVNLGPYYKEIMIPGKENIVECQATAQIIPLKESLVQLLGNEEVWDHVFGEKVTTGKTEMLTSAKDGDIYLNHPTFKNYPNPLIFELYEDDCEFVNPLGSHTKVHKMTNVYWSLLNLPPWMRSSLKSIFLLACVRAEFVKKYGFQEILRDFLETIGTMEKPEGLRIKLNGKEIILHGSLLCTCGDGLAMNLLAGFKESIGGAKKPCRNCTLTRIEMDFNFFEPEMKLRNMIDHENDVAQVLDLTKSKKERERCSTESGVVGESVLRKFLKSYDVTLCFPQDIMHNLMEGALEHEMRSMLNQFIEVDGYLTFRDLNRSLKCFIYPDELISSKPSIIDRQHVTDGKLRQSATQMITLSIVLPIILASFVSAPNEYYENFILLCQITNVLLAYEVKRESIPLLRSMIYIHNTRYFRLYEKIIPKFHFLTHAPSVIQNFGPCRETWCMRFEARHCWFGKVASRSNNYKNLAKSLAYRHQMKKCYEFEFGDGCAKVLGEKHFKAIFGSSVEICSYKLGFRVAQVLDLHPSEKLLNSASCVFVKNFCLQPKNIVLFKDDKYSLPEFAEIKALFVNGEKCALVLNLFDTLEYDEYRNAYCVTKTNQFTCVNSNQLPTMQNFPLFQYDNKMYIVLNYYDRNEFYG